MNRVTALSLKRSLRKHAALSNLLDVLKSAHVTLVRAARRRKRAVVLGAKRVLEFGDQNLHTFFGYHDITPFSRDGKRVLAGRVPLNPEPETSMEVGCFRLDGNTHEFIQFDSTTSWCWQMGARLQWWGSDDSYVYYNKTIDGQYRSVVYDSHKRQAVRTYGLPLYSIAPDVRYGVSLNFSRLERLRPGYGYKDRPDETMTDPMPANDGLWLVDLHSGDAELVVSLATIARLLPSGTSTKCAEHYFNHILWSPDSTKFLFLHLIAVANGGRSGRAFIYDIASGDCKPLELSGYVSHFAWRNSTEIIMYSRNERTGVGLNLYNIVTGAVHAVGRQSVRNDCHPMFSPVDPNLVLLDSYPRRPLMERELYLLDIEKDERRDIASFYSPLHLAGVQRCDLHPRWDATGRWVAVDSGHADVRRLVALEIPGA